MSDHLDQARRWVTKADAPGNLALRAIAHALIAIAERLPAPREGDSITGWRDGRR